MKKVLMVIGIAAYAFVSSSAPVKSLVAARSVVSTTSENVSYTAADYIQDGLVAMWDGIENAGWGVHDENATVWKNLLGDTGYDFPNCMSWDNNCFDLDSSAASVLNTSSLNIRTSKNGPASTTNPYTIEMAWKPYGSGSGNESILFGFALDGNNRTVCAFRSVYSGDWSNSNTKSMGVRIHTTTELPNVYGLSGNYLGFSPNYSSGIVITATFENGILKVYFRGMLVYETTTSISSWALPLVIGTSRRSGFLTISGKVYGKYYRCSWYGRALTEEEVLHNYRIDKIRFNLP